MSDSNDKRFSNEAETLWFVARLDVLMGPFTTNQIVEKIAIREYSALDYCWRQGFSEWRPINSVEEFDRRGKFKTLSTYPTIEVPGTSSNRKTPIKTEDPLAQAGISKFAKKSDMPKRDKIEVTFAKVRKGPLSIYEWAGALIFTLCFSYFAVDFALNEVEEKILARMQWIQLGIIEDEGFVPTQSSGSPAKVTPVWMWDPLLSAPGIKDVHRLESHSSEPGIPSLPRNYVGFMRQVTKPLAIEGADSRAPASVFDEKLEADPVVGGQRWFRGYLSFENKFEVKVIPVGSPENYLP